MSMEDLLQAILGGAGAQTQRQGSRSSGQQDPLADLLQGILGGAGGAQPGRAQQPSAGLEDVLGGILGGILGGGAQQMLPGGMGGTAERTAPQPAQSGGISDFLGGILGRAPMQDNSFLGPIVEKLAKQLGLPPVVAQMIVSFALSKLLPSLSAGGASATPGARPGAVVPAPSPTQPLPQAQQGLDLDDLLDRMGSGQALGTGYLSSTGMAQELAQQTGMDNSTAVSGLQEVFKLLGSALGGFQQTQTPAQTKRTAAQRARAKATQRKTSRSKSTTRKRTTSKQGGSKGSDLDSLLDGFDI